MKILRANNIVATAIFIFILLFTYTALSKILHMKAFTGALKASPLLAPYTQWLAWTIILAELITVLFLIIIPLRLLGLYTSFALMFVFTSYIAYMLLTSSSLPCSCGGILKQLSWQSHLILNGLLTLLAVVALIGEINNLKKKKPALT